MVLERKTKMEDVKQGKILNIAYSGVEGAFANIAAKNIFPDMNMVACSDFSEAYESVVNDTCDFAVLPIENSYAGEVGHVMDLMFSGNLNVVGIYYLRVTHNLLAIKGAKLEDIKTVISHPQALEQCRGYIKAHGFEKIQEKNTAFSAKQVSEKGDKSLAAIASVETAKLYGLEVLAHEINESNDNTTRFAVLSKKKIAHFNDEGVYIGSASQDKDVRFFRRRRQRIFLMKVYISEKAIRIQPPYLLMQIIFLRMKIQGIAIMATTCLSLCLQLSMKLVP